MTTPTAPFPLLLSVVDEDETQDPFCICPDGMPCWCVADSTDSIDYED